MDLPYQTYEKITGNKWTGGNSPEVMAMYTKYGIKDAPASAEANLALQKALLAEKPVSTTPVVGTQNSVVQDTSSIRAQDNNTASAITDKVNTMTGTGTPTGTSVIQGGSGTGNPNVNTTNGDIQGVDGKIYKTSAPSGYTYNLPPLSDGKKYVYDANGRPMIQDATGAISNDTYADSEYEKNKDAITKATEYNNLFDTYKVGLDASHQVLVDSIKKQAEIQSKKMEELNKMTLGAKTVQGYRTGSTEYTPEIDTGIIKKEIQSGMDRLEEIDANMRLALAQAESAKNSKDFELAGKRLETANALQKAKEESIQNIYKSYVDNTKAINDALKARETEQRATKDQALQELAVSAPELTKQYDGLKTDADRKLWLTLMVKKTGLDETILKGALEKSKLEIANKNSIIDKRGEPSKESVQKNYDEKTIAKDLKQAILTDIKGVKGLTLNDLFDAYPEVSTSYLKELYNTLYQN